MNKSACCFKKNVYYYYTTDCGFPQVVGKEFINKCIDYGIKKCENMINDENLIISQTLPEFKYLFVIDFDNDMFQYYDSGILTYQINLIRLHRYIIDAIYQSEYRLE